MKYTKEERLEIGRRIYEGELTVAMAAEEYEINIYTARDYLRSYKASINVAIPKSEKKDYKRNDTLSEFGQDFEELKKMSQEELIDEVIKARVNEARAKKGYEVRGGGRSKEFRALGSKNTKS